MAGRNQAERDYSYDMQYTKYYSSVENRHVRSTSCQQRLYMVHERVTHTGRASAGGPGKNRAY